MKNRKKLLLILLVLIAIIGVTVGVTYAFLSYTKEGVKENTITSGAITFHYNEDSNQGISLIDALPLSDGDGKTQNKYFDFTITSNNNMETSIPYQITARKENVANQLDEQYIKVYLTKVTTINDVDTEDSIPVLFDTYNNLFILNYNNHDEEILWTDSVPANTANYIQKYRLRIWIADSLDFSPLKDSNGNYIEENGDYVYPNNNKEFSIKLNVYGGDAKQADPAAPTLTNLSITSQNITPVLDQTLGYDYITDELPAGTSSTTLNVTTESPYDTVTVEKLDGTALNIEQSNVRRLSNTIPVVLSDLHIGNNDFRINVISNSRTKISFVIRVAVDSNYVVDIPYSSSSYRELTLTELGRYKIELWGAQGGSYDATYHGGYGGYTEGIINITEPVTLYVNVGGQPESYAGGANGGGTGGYDLSSTNSKGGGGATDVRYANNNISSRIMVAAGGGGAGWCSTGAPYHVSGSAAGGLTGYSNHFDEGDNQHPGGKGGSQIAAGYAKNYQTQTLGTFGSGGNGYTYNGNDQYTHTSGGGGGGYYGGGGGASGRGVGYSGPGGGGSSYISGHVGCVAIQSDAVQLPKTGCDTNPLGTGCSEHYSGLVFMSGTTKIIDGSGYKWTTEKSTKENMPRPDGGTYDDYVGHSGSGYARITYLGE